MENIVENMRLLAERKHFGKTRVGESDLPYIVHPTAVVGLLKKWGYSESENAVTLAIGWGHDLLEDTDAREDEILTACGEFGQQVLDGIRKLTFRPGKGLTDEEYDSQKSRYMESVATSEPAVLVVKIADRLCNARDFLCMSRDKAKSYLEKGEFLFRRIYDEGRENIPYVDKIVQSYLEMQLQVEGNEAESYESFLKFLAKEAVDHIAYYHYTQWDALAKMMEHVEVGRDGSHRMLVLTRAGLSNDGLEARWPSNYYMACFSLSRYEDVAMWLNYGKGSGDAVRVKFTRESMDEWLADAQPGKATVYSARWEGGRFKYEEDMSDLVASVRLYGVAYVIPSHHWVTARDEVGSIQDGNLEIGRKFHKVEKDGRFDWVNAIYRAEDLSKMGIPPVFKKRGWAYEREIRLVVEMKALAHGKSCPDRIGLAFDGPLDCLAEQMGMDKAERDRRYMSGASTKKIRVGDPRFPLVQQGPWYEHDDTRAEVCGFDLADAVRSEYVNEIRVLEKREVRE